jgi:hypothetical protein
MSGPGKTIMLKIASLLTHSNSTQKCLTFDADRRGEHTARYARFDRVMPRHARHRQHDQAGRQQPERGGI